MSATNCIRCGAVIKMLVDPCMYQEHGWYHVRATDNNDGQYVFECPGGQGQTAEPWTPISQEAEQAMREGAQ